MARSKSPAVPPDGVDLYDRLLAAADPPIERKDAASPYTLLNGHMFSVLSVVGVLALRSPAGARERFLTEAFTAMYGDGDAETDEGDALCHERPTDKENLLADVEAFDDDLTRPVGETVAMLCVALGLPADTCVKERDAWLARRAPSPFETFRETPAAGGKPTPATAVSSP